MQSPTLLAMKAQGRAIFALMLRDIRTRFFGHGLGYLLMIAWPLAHISVLLVGYAIFHRANPYGESLVVFFSTGLIPFMIFSYMSRFIMLSLLQNFPLLSFPAIQVTSILFARAILEICSSVLIVCIFIVILWCLGEDFWPRDPLQAIFALATVALYGFGFGIVNGVIGLAIRGWYTVVALLIAIFWMTSGVWFVPDNLPAVLREALSYNPVLQCIEWMRSAYYDDYGSLVLDKSYAFWCGVISAFSGLLLERLVRARLLQG